MTKNIENPLHLYKKWNQIKIEETFYAYIFKRIQLLYDIHNTEIPEF